MRTSKLRAIICPTIAGKIRDGSWACGLSCAAASTMSQRPDHPCAGTARMWGTLQLIHRQAWIHPRKFCSFLPGVVSGET
jgi:hypothetical protein